MPNVGQNKQLMYITHMHRVGPTVVDDVAIEVEERFFFFWSGGRREIKV